MFIDAHTHAQFAIFDADRAEVLKRAKEADIWMINAGTQRSTSEAAIRLAEENKEGVFATVGLHPIHTGPSFHDADESGDKDVSERGEKFDREAMEKLARHPKVVGIGECGLDYFRVTEGELKEKQKNAFREQIALAEEVKKPIIIHCREAFEDLIATLKENRPSRPGVVHFFTGSIEDARALLDLSFYFTFGGVITFARSYDEVLGIIPADRILSETDAPYVAPVPYRGKRNEPAYVVEVVKKLAEIKGLPLEEMKEIIWNNAKTVFSI